MDDKAKITFCQKCFKEIPTPFDAGYNHTFCQICITKLPSPMKQTVSPNWVGYTNSENPLY